MSYFKSIIKKVQDNGEFSCFLPIQKLDDVKVKVFLKLKKFADERDVIFYIKIYDDVFNENLFFNICEKSSLNEESLNLAFNKLKSFLESLKFDKFHGVLTDKDNVEISHWLTELFSDLNDNLECCVCYEKTRSITPCCHRLCLVCRQNLQNNKCPLCREDLFQLDSGTVSILLDI